MDQSPEAIGEKNVELTKNVQSTTYEVLISSIIPVEINLLTRNQGWTTLLKNSVKKMRQSNLCGKNLLMQGNILERMKFTSTILAYSNCQRFYQFFSGNTGYRYKYFNKKTNELANNYGQNSLDIFWKETKGNFSFLSELKEMIKSYVTNIIVGQLIINSLRNKFSFVKELLSQNLDLMIIKKMKLDDNFPNAQFLCAKIGASLVDIFVFT